ncbi:cyclin-like protein [Lipomyces tetrasporus]|uniref:Cyclin-like protein n=1 Tax=Lipomyces tetrasporus TaxID=54092 RepID=A0AAD7QMV2_9ASCO|nr:cyclin-like protein [Lipomyces tetrasporus]KAJ8097968.1 cyclin-like protein [Lipomyces tetrasporus]
MNDKRPALPRLTNALATPAQLQESHTRGLTPSLISSLHYLGGSLIQIAGAILNFPDPAIATSAIIFHRFHLLAGFLEPPIRNTAAACIYIASKSCEIPLRPSAILAAVDTACEDPLAVGGKRIPRRKYSHANTETLDHWELRILTTLAFDMHVVTPYTLFLEYLVSMNVDKEREKTVAQRGWNYINDIMKTRICIFHQPNVIAVTAVWLAAREADVEMLDGEKWWEAFDVDTEDMGHVVLLLREGRDIATRERDRIVSGREPTLTVEEVKLRVVEEASLPSR